jgi:hypothetical protein
MLVPKFGPVQYFYVSLVPSFGEELGGKIYLSTTANTTEKVDRAIAGTTRRFYVDRAFRPS